MAAKKTTEKKKVTLAEVQAQRNITRITDFEQVDKIPTGIFEFDNKSEGGFPVGKMAELYGPTGGGKSSIALSTAAQAQQLGAVVWFDLESAFNADLAERIGVDVDALLFPEHSSAEDVFQTIEDLVRTNEVSLIVVDSVAGLVPRAEIAGDYGDSHMGLLARTMSQGLRKLAGSMDIEGNRTTVLWINQIRANMNTFGYGPTTTTTGGNALPFWCGTRVEIKRIEQIKQGDDVVGQKVQAFFQKARFARPFTKAKFDIVYDRGFDNSGSIIEACIDAGYITKSGSWLSDAETGEVLAQGKQKLAVMFDDDHQLLDQYVQKVTTEKS